MATLIYRMVSAVPVILLLWSIGAESFADTDLRRLAIYNNYRALIDVDPGAGESAVVYAAPRVRPSSTDGKPGNPWLGARLYDQDGEVLGSAPPLEVPQGGFRSLEIKYACGSNICDVYVDNKDGSGPRLLPGKAKIVGSRPAVLLRLTCVHPCPAKEILPLKVIKDAADQSISLEGEELLIMREEDIIGIIEEGSE